MIPSSDKDSVDSLPRRRKSPAHLLLVAVAFGVIGITCYGSVQLVCASASMIRSDIQSFASYHEPTKTLIVISALMASIPVGPIAVNLLVYAVRPLRRFFDEEAKSRKGEDFTIATRGLLKFSKYWLPLFGAMSLGAAFFGR